MTARLRHGVATQEIIRAAFAKDLAITRLEVREPTLHEAFIVLTGSPTP